METKKGYNSYNFSEALHDKINHPVNVGIIADKKREGIRVVSAKEGSFEEGCFLYLSFMVDEEDGIIVDAKFQAFGPPEVIGAAEITCSLLVSKNYMQASRLSTDLIENSVHDKSKEKGFSSTSATYLNLVVSATQDAMKKCMDIPIDDALIHSPLENVSDSSNEVIDWQFLQLDEKLQAIKSVIEEDIQPYIELDAGGIEVLELKDDKEVIIAYHGACTTCPSATGTTLNAIQGILTSKVAKHLVVVPDKSFLPQSI